MQDIAPRSDPSDLLSGVGLTKYLTASLGGSPSQWARWLANDRRRARVLTPVIGPGRPKYLRSAVESFIQALRARRAHDASPAGRIAAASHALGVGLPGGSPTGRQLECQVLHQEDSLTGERFVQLCLAMPLLVYRLSAGQSRELASMLIAAASGPIDAVGVDAAGVAS